ncbi:hypothetical protein [Cryobacterium sp. CG_9.6]|uniref:hypothetical protein n=1 Tax=Cryobacterium sp. CG_9.6 TaxID=2760710 RepID=UPI002474BA33|nr:hypothetical protein [Cryobacterium sp. CG_9.6]MDH6237900.1 hypothetical protein [Cryobacterium sp. CG_9.6]
MVSLADSVLASAVEADCLGVGGVLDAGDGRTAFVLGLEDLGKLIGYGVQPISERVGR